MDELAQWDQADQPQTDLTVEQMDQMIKHLRVAKLESDAKQAEADEFKATYNKHRDLVLAALTTLKRDNYSVDGAGMVYISNKEVYNVPKTNEDKTALFNYIKTKYGNESLMAMVGIHSATLTSWANKETETGEVQSIPGLSQPTMIQTLNFRKKD